MVSYAKEYIREEAHGSEAWWAHSKSHGWVVLDKSLPHNRQTQFPEELEFIRCRDWKVYRQEEQPWNYREAGRYLDSIPMGAALEEQRILMQLQEQFEATRYQVA